jgi:Mn2+/Fe2+ NRAMP family transporter
MDPDRGKPSPTVTTGRNLIQRRGATPQELHDCTTDVVTGMFVSNPIMYFVILTTGTTLHASGQTTIATAREAAEALRPLAGDAAYWLFMLGIIGTGMLAVSVLAGSCAYAVGEAAAWRPTTLLASARRAGKVYATMGVAMGLGWALTYAGFNAIHLLFMSAVINGVLAPPLVLIIVLLTSDRAVMGDAVNSRAHSTALGWATFGVITAAACGLLIGS